MQWKTLMMTGIFAAGTCGGIVSADEGQGTVKEQKHKAAEHQIAQGQAQSGKEVPETPPWPNPEEETFSVGDREGFFEAAGLPGGPGYGPGTEDSSAGSDVPPYPPPGERAITVFRDVE